MIPNFYVTSSGQYVIVSCPYTVFCIGLGEIFVWKTVYTFNYMLIRYLYIDMECYCGYGAMVLPFHFMLYNATYNAAKTIFHYKSEE